MGVKSIENTDRLYWLGRYSERVYTTLKLFEHSYDTMVETGAGDYEGFCDSLEIPNIYGSSEDFLRTYPFSTEDPNSIMSNLYRAYDNAIELREEIGSETLCYIQLAVYAMKKAAITDAPLLEFQKVRDNILAFWGIADDMIEDENTRNIIKVGKRVERIDLYGRLHVNKESMTREVNRLDGRIRRCEIHFREDVITALKQLITEEPMNYGEIVRQVEQILEV